MTKQEFVDAVAGKTGLSKRDAGAAVDAFLDTVEDALKAGDTVTFTGFRQVPHDPSGGAHGRQPAQPEREGPDQGGDRAEVLGRLGAEEGRQLTGAPSSEERERGPRGALSFALWQTNICSSRMGGCSSPSTPPTGSSSSSRRATAPIPAGEAARSLFALASAPTAIARSLLDDVVSGDARLAWRGAAVGLADAARCRDRARGGDVRRLRPRDDRALAGPLAHRRDRRPAGRGARAGRHASRRSSTPACRCRRRSPRSPGSAPARCAGRRGRISPSAGSSPSPATRCSSPTTRGSTWGSSTAPSSASRAGGWPRRSSTRSGSRGGSWAGGRAASASRRSRTSSARPSRRATGRSPMPPRRRRS